ncbi:pyocin knob domain-containing protein [Tritonibacter sp. AK171]|uniref:pyocin knob domain-containing protein n=1 Tax=Tritonibacter sp. AK171 TaxID=3048493 RepID=UPI0024C33591|nr:pyocin knob domain-containing protein [Tritonibacter sp. AK171]
MSIPSFSAFPEIPQRSTPEADFDAKMYALFQHFATTHRQELLAFIQFLENNVTAIEGAINGVTIGLTHPAAAKFTSLAADSISGAAVQASVMDTDPGKLTTVGAFGWGGGAPEASDASITDMNDLTTAGVWTISGTVANKPDGTTGNAGVCLVLKRKFSAGPSVTQLLSYSSDVPILWVRVATGAPEVWSPWSKVYSQASLLGTVAQSGGVPTGAVIERGSNANGEYVRFADGTQICVSPDFTYLDVTHPAGALYRTAAPVSWTPPAGFGGVDSMSGAVLSQGNSQTHWGTMRVINSNSIDISVYAPNSTTGRAVRAMVIGRWF